MWSRYDHFERLYKETLRRPNFHQGELKYNEMKAYGGQNYI